MKYRVLSFEKARMVSCNALGFRCMGRGLGETWRRPVALPRSLSPPRSALPSSAAAAVLLCSLLALLLADHRNRDRVRFLFRDL